MIPRCEMRESEMQCFLDTRALKQASHQSNTCHASTSYVKSVRTCLQYAYSSHAMLHGLNQDCELHALCHCVLLFKSLRMLFASIAQHKCSTECREFSCAPGLFWGSTSGQAQLVALFGPEHARTHSPSSLSPPPCLNLRLRRFNKGGSQARVYGYPPQMARTVRRQHVRVMEQQTRKVSGEHLSAYVLHLLRWVNMMMMMMTFITRRGQGQGKTKKERKATKSKGRVNIPKGRGLEKGASRALMRQYGEEGCGERG